MFAWFFSTSFWLCWLQTFSVQHFFCLAYFRQKSACHCQLVSFFNAPMCFFKEIGLQLCTSWVDLSWVEFTIHLIFAHPKAVFSNFHPWVDPMWSPPRLGTRRFDSQQKTQPFYSFFWNLLQKMLPPLPMGLPFFWAKFTTPRSSQGWCFIYKPSPHVFFLTGTRHKTL